MPSSQLTRPCLRASSTWSFGSVISGLAPHSRTTGLAGLVAADGAGFVGEVRDVEQQIVLLGGGVFGLHVECGDLFVDGADLGLDGGGVLALGLELADLLGNGFPRALELLFGGLQRTAGLVAGEHVVDEFPMIAAPGFEAILDGGGVVADDADIEHGGRLSRAMGGGINGNFHRMRDSRWATHRSDKNPARSRGGFLFPTDFPHLAP